MTFSYAYNDDAKKVADSKFKKALSKVAKALGLTKEQFDLRFNPGGIAVWGEVTLHTDTVYIQASKGHDMGVLVRTCKGRKDYTGGRNNYLPVALLLSNPEEFAQKIRYIY
jgi:hypothetical protein